FMTNGIPPKSNVTLKVMFLPSTFPSLIGTSAPSNPVVDPVSFAPSALKLKVTARSPLGVVTFPVHLPSTSAASAATEKPSTSVRTAKNFISILLRKRVIPLGCPNTVVRVTKFSMDVSAEGLPRRKYNGRPVSFRELRITRRPHIPLDGISEQTPRPFVAPDCR